jgi:predicted glycosyltransferase
VFTHDAFGLGHVRRSTRIVRAVVERDSGATVLLITGSPATHLLRDLPPRVDYLKLPTIVTSGAENTRPSTLDIGVAELAALRGELTRCALETFEPDVLLVDNFPLGTRLELLPTLRSLRHRPTRTILGLRDVVDPPEKVRKDWSRDGLYGVVGRYYDRVLVYGMREVLDAAEAYQLPGTVAEKLRYCGYVTAGSAVRPPDESRAEAGIGPGFLLATVGGGGDGRPLLEAFLGALDRFPDRPALVLTGEFMGETDREALHSLASGRPGLILREHVADLPSLMAAADLVVAMGGYNTSAELLAVGARAILVPRTWRSGEHDDRAKARIDGEQLVRAESLARTGAVDLIHPRKLSAESLAEAIARALDEPRRPPQLDLRLDGAARVASQLLELAHPSGVRVRVKE